MKGVPFPLELCRGVDLVGHYPGDRLLHVLHPLGHLGVPHLVHLLDELVVLLPECHVAGRVLSVGGAQATVKFCSLKLTWNEELITTDRQCIATPSFFPETASHLKMVLMKYYD